MHVCLVTVYLFLCCNLQNRGCLFVLEITGRTSKNTKSPESSLKSLREVRDASAKTRKCCEDVVPAFFAKLKKLLSSAELLYCFFLALVIESCVAFIRQAHATQHSRSWPTQTEICKRNDTIRDSKHEQIYKSNACFTHLQQLSHIESPPFYPPKRPTR